MAIKGINRIQLPSFVVIGKEGQGLAEEASSWVALLWDQMNTHFDEISPLINVTEMSQLHLWGLMSDRENWLLPWQTEGRYLAGVQVSAEAAAPIGWTRWEMPAMEYLTVKASAEKIGEATELMLGQVLPLEKVQLAGSVQEHYLPSFAEGEVELFFPIRPLI
ncbi:AraC family transcriptional regulator [Enterococcus florum]|uniref:AraC family transcriptional regulator n=1 Tax=Enterococcus florum TaxID=2480627 RepID=A0A4P5P5G6_9ENTE|nr:GyrI-like domain-containing protein [Enterococcus florum]GCF92930.1 AraC family transcriptional regulator [Enterococcus florum]